MSDENVNPDLVATKPLPMPATAAPTEPIAAELPDVGGGMPPARPTWIAPALIVGFFALLLVIAVLVIPVVLAQRANPAPSVTPTLATPTATPTVSEEAPQQEEPTTEEPPVVVDPQPTETAPESTEPPVEPEPTPTP